MVFDQSVVEHLTPIGMDHIELYGTRAEHGNNLISLAFSLFEFGYAILCFFAHVFFSLFFLFLNKGVIEMEQYNY